MNKSQIALENIKKKYRLSHDEIFESDGIKIIKKSGIAKIRKRENIEHKITNEIVIPLSTKIGTEEGVFLTGVGTKRLKNGFVCEETTQTASATPFNCTFPYKMETAQKRLYSRIVLTLAGLDDCMSVDEIDVNTSRLSPTEVNTQGQEYINSALSKMNDKNRRGL